MRAPLAARPVPQELLAVAGEYEGFQFALRNGTGQLLRLTVRITGDAELAGTSGSIGVRVLRVGFVDLPVGSSGLGTRPGLYADPLPELRPAAGAPGLLTVAPERWGGIVVRYAVRTDATAGVRHGTLELVSADGVTVYARQPFSLDVRRLYGRVAGATQSLLQPGSSPQAMKTVLGVEGDRYWLGDPAMRNGRVAGFPSEANRGAQLQGLLRFFDDHGVAPLNWPLASPSASGSYDPCHTTATQLSRYLEPERAIAPGRQAFPARVMPTKTEGCRPELTTDDYEPTRDVRGTPGVEQDDVLRSTARTFWTGVYAQWAASGWIAAGRTYAINPFDEPSDTTAIQRATMNVQVPAATEQLRRATRGRVRVFLSSWPRDERLLRACIAGRCATFGRDAYGNRRMWDGRGLDDPHVWSVPFSRLYGRTASRDAILFRIGREHEYRDRLRAVKRLPGGREVWAYNFFTATRSMPQLVIDAPGTDARLQYWLLAREGHSGLFVSNSMIGWSAVTRYISGTRLRERGNPFRQATYFRHGAFGYGAGWGTLLYPAYDPELGLVEERDRNTELSRPTSSLRMEGMRNGQEDANLVLMYRRRFGSAMVEHRMRSIFLARMRPLPRMLGSVVFPAWSTVGLPQRLESQRRAMIIGLSRQGSATP